MDHIEMRALLPHPNQIRQSHTIRDILPILLLWITLGIIVFFLIISTISLIQVNPLLDDLQNESSISPGVSTFDAELGSNNNLPILPSFIGPLAILFIGFTVGFSGIYILTVYNQPVPLKELLSESMLHLVKPKTSSDRKIILDFSFSLLSMSWTKTRGLPRSWTITIQLDICNTALCHEFAELLLMNRFESDTESVPTVTYYKTIKAHTWPHTEYLLRYWLKNLII